MGKDPHASLLAKARKQGASPSGGGPPPFMFGHFFFLTLTFVTDEGSKVR
jgi:hypothetical protein